MSQYLFVYHGGSKPETPEQIEEVMLHWSNWLESLSDAVIDGGNPVGQSSTVLSDGDVLDDGGSNPVSGYGIFAASDHDEAVSMARECPILDSGGSVEIAEIVQM